MAETTLTTIRPVNMSLPPPERTMAELVPVSKGMDAFLREPKALATVLQRTIGIKRLPLSCARMTMTPENSKDWLWPLAGGLALILASRLSGVLLPRTAVLEAYLEGSPLDL